MTRIGTIQTLQFPPIDVTVDGQSPLCIAPRIGFSASQRHAVQTLALDCVVGWVGEHSLDAVSVGVGELQLRAGCGGSRRMITRGPVRPRGEVQSLDVSDLRDLLALSVLPVLAERWTPSVLGQLQDRSRTLVNRSNPTRNPMFASCAAWHRADAAPAESIRITI